MAAKTDDESEELATLRESAKELATLRESAKSLESSEEESRALRSQLAEQQVYRIPNSIIEIHRCGLKKQQLASVFFG